jgi:hypothetical protein
LAKDSQGVVRWTDPKFLPVDDQSTELTFGATTVVRECEVPIDSHGFFECAAPALVGRDTQSGAERWRVPGRFEFGVTDHGLAMVLRRDDAGGGVWQLWDLRTGVPVGPEQWSLPNAMFFTPGQVAGGIVITYLPGRIDVWWPKALTTSPTRVVSAT